MSSGRILILAHTYQPEGVSEGFTASQLVAALRRRGRRMTVFTAKLARLRLGYGELGIRCRTETETPFITAQNYSEFALRSLILGRRIRNRYSIVHHVSPISIRLPSLGGGVGLPFIWGPVGGSVPYPPGFQRYSRATNLANAVRFLDKPRLYVDPTLRLTLCSAARIVVTTSAAAAMIPDAHHDKVLIIPEGIPDALLLSAPVHEEPYIFSSGRLIDYKAMDLLIRAFALVNARDVKLVITGDGPNKAELLALIGRLELTGQVELLGGVSRERNQQLMRHSLFCIFPAIREAFGHVNLEAMAAWKPVVATDWGGPRDLIVNDSNGIKVLGRNPEEHVELLRDAIRRLLGDSQLRRRMGAAGAARVKSEYGWPVLAARYDKLYSDLAA
jgi:glycosyltransferase involved in cell wall biosynthesis